MADRTIGFFVPESFSASYVNNIKDEEGTYKYENQLRDVGMQKQAAIQDLKKALFYINDKIDMLENEYKMFIKN